MRRQRASRKYFLTLLTTWPAHGQAPAPAEFSSLPRWPGEDAAAKLSPPRYVFRDANGQIVVSYALPENPGHRVLYRFWLPNRVAPQVTASVAETNEFVYNYILRNDAGAVSSIANWSI